MNDRNAMALFDREDFGDVTVLRVYLTMLDTEAVTSRLFEEAGKFVDESQRSRLVLNTERIQFMGSMALGSLVKLMHKVRSASGAMVLCCVPRSIHELLRITHLEDLLMTYDDEGEAIQSFNKVGELKARAIIA
jgi:anti-anti-sigma factor